MTAIKLLDARRGLNLKCRELFRDEKVAETIYRYLCDGIEECEDAQPERKTGRWERHVTCHGDDISGFVVHEWICSECGGQANVNAWRMYDLTDFCPNCGADMRKPTQVQLDEADDVMMGGENGKTD